MTHAEITTPATLEPVAESASLKLHIQGLSAVERKLVDGIVKLSERDTRRRTPRLQLLPGDQCSAADVVIVDARDAAAMAWARLQAWLPSRPVIWVDAAGVPAGHTLVRRPVQWPILPVILSRAMEQGPQHMDGPAATGAHAAASSSSSVPRVLLVDDSVLARMQLRGELEQRGFDVDEAGSVDEALARLAQHRADGVLMDVLMPGVDGYEGCRRVKAQFRGRDAMPVVMLTSKSSPFDRIRGKMAGCDAYLTKPINRVELNDVLARHVRQPQRPVATPHATPSQSVLAPSLQ